MLFSAGGVKWKSKHVVRVFTKREIICKSRWLEKSSSDIFKGNGRNVLRICALVWFRKVLSHVIDMGWNNKKGWGEGRGLFEKITVGEGWRTVRRIVNQYQEFSTPLNEVLSFKGWIVKCSWRTTRNRDKHTVRRRTKTDQLYKVHLQSGNFDTDCFGLSGDKFTRRLCSRARSKTRRKGCQRLSRAFSTGTILEWQEWQSNISPWKHGYL